MKRRIDHDKVRALCDEGFNNVEIAKRCGCSEQHVSNILLGRFNTKLDDIGADRRRRLTDEQIEEIPKLYAEGFGIREIAVRFNVSDTAIRYRLFPKERERLNNESRAWRIMRLAQDEEFRNRCRDAVRESVRYRKEILAAKGGV